MTRTAIFAAAAACLLGTTAAAAPIRKSVTIEEVTYADLDLGSRPGRAALERRIRAAATRVCAKYDMGSTATDRTVARPCYLHAVESAQDQMRQVIAKTKAAQGKGSAQRAVRHD